MYVVPGFQLALDALRQWSFDNTRLTKNTQVTYTVNSDFTATAPEQAEDRILRPVTNHALKVRWPTADRQGGHAKLLELMFLEFVIDV